MQHKVTYKRVWLTLIVVLKVFEKKKKITEHSSVLIVTQHNIYIYIYECYSYKTAGFPSGREKKRAKNPLENTPSPMELPM